ncbi:MAG: exopolyphosphatase [Rhodospirillales bacterium]
MTDSQEQRKYRLITRADFDGVVSGVLFRELDIVDDVVFVEPKAMQDGDVPVSDNDITSNLPFVPGVHLCFDHHLSEAKRVADQDNRVIDPKAPSAARVVFNHYGGKARFPNIPDDLLAAVDKADSAQYSEDEVLAPTGWTFLNFLIDPRTGLGRFKDFSIPTQELMKDLMFYCRNHSVDEILHLPDVEERRHLYYEHEERAEMQMRRIAKVLGNVVVLDYRGEDIIFASNRFMVYALFPECNVSIHILPNDGSNGRVLLAVGASIINRSLKTSIGPLMLTFGGGGHAAAGTCQVQPESVDSTLDAVVKALQG